jgi:hypothetical protein
MSDDILTRSLKLSVEQHGIGSAAINSPTNTDTVDKMLGSLDSAVKKILGDKGCGGCPDDWL